MSKAMCVEASAVRREGKFVPEIFVDGEARYFTSPRPDADHVAFKDAPAAEAHAELFLGELRKIVLHELQAGGFITPGEPG